MAITISNAFVNNYSNLVRQLAQQKVTRLRPKVTEVSSNGEAYMFERLGATAAVEKTTRRLDTQYIDDDWSRRVATPKTFTHAMTIEHEDRVMMLVDPQSAYAQNQAMAMNRAMDDVIIGAFTSDAANDTGAPSVFPVAQTVGDGTAPISFDLVTQVQEKFMTNEIMPDEAKCMVISPKQVRKLMQMTEQTSSDYVRDKALQELNSTGICLGWMGFDWVVSNRLLAPAGGEIDCMAFTKDAFGLAVNQNTFTRIGEDPSKSYMIQVFSQWTMGAVRVEDEKCVRLHLLDS